MTVRAVDMQIVVQKSAEIMKDRYLEDSKTRLQMQQQAQMVQQKSLVENHQVKNAQGAENNAIHNNKEKSDDRQNRGNDKKKNKKKKTMVNSHSCTIDVKI